MNTSHAVLARWSPIILALVLSSCGGGGGSSNPTCPNDCPYTVGGTVTGLATGNTVVLLNNGGDLTTVSANTTFTFATALAPFTQYAVTVGTQPTGQTCTVTNGSGTSSGTIDVTNVSVTCAANPGGTYTVTATVTGLIGQGVVLELNGSQDQMVAADGTVTFPSGLMTGASYAVTVKTQPTTRRDICGVSNGSGTIADANVTTVAINCSIVLGFLYQTANTANQTQARYQLLSYGISAGTGSLVAFGTPLVTDSPSPGGAMVTSPGGGFLILSSESNANATDGSISVYAVNSDTGALTAVSSVVTTLFRPTYMVMSPQGRLFVLGAGAPGFPPGTPGYKSVLAVYLFDASAGTLTPTGTPLTVSAVNLAVRPDGKFLYVLNVDFNSNTPVPATLTAYAINGTTGALTAGPVLTWMTSQNNGISTGGSGMAIDALGRFLYLASEQGDTIQAAATVLPYAIDPDNGTLTPIGTGTPIVSNAGVMTADPSGRYLYVANSLNSSAANDTVLAMAIDQISGVVSLLGSPLQTGGPPYTMICEPSGQFVYAGTGGSTFFDPTATDLVPFAISTAPSTPGELVPSGESGLSTQTIAVAIVE